jgi:hypothetical protein
LRATRSSAFIFLRTWRRCQRVFKMRLHFGGSLVQIACCDRRDNRDMLAAPVLDAATVRIAAIDAEPVLVQYIGGTFVTIFPAAVALDEALWPMNA